MRNKGYKTESLDKTIERFVDKNSAKEQILNEMYEEMKLGIIMDNLRELRKKKGLTLKEVAELMETSESAMSRLEKQIKNVTISTLARYAKVLGRKIEIRVV
ncbi:MAG TPA: helix-turn-helix transcriptional regulator [bacterium]|jgi:DNA-directed RNA polymerase specialized sigma subunit|nr:helix-turn-helix transcriptional regulator [bacterium]HNZ53248.1 helix-turn-helix transcriptional regulator [bacterium]HOB71082.1 helix-turn-helix transcriptional regulator [bacterium]HOG43546.1 helix-turn-helix transcriptional regulator [bacterium]HPG35582.1 helix-turn-helix transcriptional regulator [bacterium]